MCALKGDSKTLVSGSGASDTKKSQDRSPKRTNKSIATRERILTSACEIMINRGSTDFQMAEIAKMCNMSKGSLYYYFTDRTSLISAAFERAATELASAVTAAVSQAPNAIEALENIVLEISLRLGEGSPLALALTHDLTLGSPMYVSRSDLDAAREDFDGFVSSHETAGSMLKVLRVVAAQLERGKNEDFVYHNVDCELAASFIVGGIHSTLQLHSQELGKTGTQEFMKRLFKSVLFGVAKPEAFDKINHLVA